MHTLANQIQKAEQIHHLTEREHLKAVGSLIKSLDKLNVVFETINQGVVVSSNQRIITNANERLVQILGYKSRDEITGKLLINLISSDDQGIFSDHIQECLIDCDRITAEYKMLKADGTAFSAEISLSPLMDKSNHPYGLVAIIRDITERGQAKNIPASADPALKMDRPELKIGNLGLKAFSSSISSELKAPLRRMEGFSQAVLEDYSDKLDEQGNYFLHRIKADSHLMAQLVDDMLKLYTMTIYRVHFEVVDLSALAQKEAEKQKYAGGEHPATLTIQPGLKAAGDKNLLQIAMEELFDNAFKFTSKTPETEIEFGKTNYKSKEAYFVKDNGIGFDMRFASKLFKPFQRLHSESEYKGNGIGLSVVQTIIYRLGGKVWAEGKKNKGATVYFTLGEKESY